MPGTQQGAVETEMTSSVLGKLSLVGKTDSPNENGNKVLLVLQESMEQDSCDPPISSPELLLCVNCQVRFRANNNAT